jgi:hypothetical protein
MVQDKSINGQREIADSTALSEPGCCISQLQTPATARDAAPPSDEHSLSPKFKSIADGTLVDFSDALSASGARLQETAQNALDLLALSGHAGSRGDTADDLRMAMIMHLHLVHEFNVRVRSAECTCEFSACARSSIDAYDVAAAKAGDIPCSISVIPAEPSRVHMRQAQRLLGIPGDLDEVLKDRSLAIVIRRVALKPVITLTARTSQLRRRPLPKGGDFKRFAANDRD